MSTIQAVMVHQAGEVDERGEQRCARCAFLMHSPVSAQFRGTVQVVPPEPFAAGELRAVTRVAITRDTPLLFCDDPRWQQ